MFTPRDVLRHIHDKLGIRKITPTLYHWELEGIIDEVPRSKTGRKNYLPEIVKKVTDIVALKAISLTHKEISDFNDGDINVREYVAELLDAYEKKIIPYLKNRIKNDD